MAITNRWGIAVAGFLMQMALGAVYAWSVFRIPLAKQFHWSIEEVTLTFTISIFVLGIACFLRRPLAEQERAARRRPDRRISLWARRLSGKLLRQQAVVALPELWSHWRNWSRIRLHCSHRCAGEVVSRSQGSYHRYCRRWLWRRSFGHRARGYSPDSKCRRPADVRLSRHRISRDYHGHRLFHAEPARRMEAGRLGSQRYPDRAACGNGLHARRRPEDLAVVGALGCCYF